MSDRIAVLENKLNLAGQWGEQLLEENTVLQQRVSQLEVDLEKKSVSSKEVTYQKLTEKIDELQREKDLLEQKNKKLEEEKIVIETTQQLYNVPTSATTAHSKDDLYSKSDNSRQKLEHIIVELEEQVSILERKNLTQEQQNKDTTERLMDEITVLQDSLNESRAQMGKMEKFKEKYENLVVEHQKKIKEAEIKNETLQKEIRHLNSTKQSSKSGEIEDIQSRLLLLQTENQNIKEALHTLGNEKNKLKTENDLLKIRLLSASGKETDNDNKGNSYIEGEGDVIALKKALKIEKQRHEQLQIEYEEEKRRNSSAEGSSADSPLFSIKKSNGDDKGIPVKSPSYLRKGVISAEDQVYQLERELYCYQNIANDRKRIIEMENSEAKMELCSVQEKYWEKEKEKELLRKKIVDIETYHRNDQKILSSLFHQTGLRLYACHNQLASQIAENNHLREEIASYKN